MRSSSSPSGTRGAWPRRALLAAGCAVLGGVALAQPAQQVTGPVAVYWMSAHTSSGFGMGAGGAPNLSAMMGGGAAQKLLTLQLGSSRSPSGEPSAEHLPPAGLRAGQSLPLVTPRTAPPVVTDPGQPMPDFQRPRGKMLIFWGCGERAPQGQPVVIDFAQLMDNPQRMAEVMRGLEIAPMQPPAHGRNTTYGEWPNERTRTQVPPDGSLAGAHTVRGNYSPEINFTLAANQDFLAPLTLTRNAAGPSGAVQLAWNPVPQALAYFATAVGGDGDTFVFWSSSEVQNAAFAAPDYIAPAEISRLVQNRALMSPQTTSCSIYREVTQAAPTAMLQMTAYGEETNVSYPPRPENRAEPWNIQWTLKVRRKSTTGAILGMEMPGFPGAATTRQAPPPAAQGGFDPLAPQQPFDPLAPQPAQPPAPPPQQPQQQQQQQQRRGLPGLPGVPRPSVGDVIRGIGGF